MGIFKVKKNSIKLIFKNSKKLDWSKNYTWVPTALHPVIGSRVIIFYGSRNKNNFTQTGYFIYCLKTKKVISNSKRPLIKLGKLGAFDDSLALATSVVDVKSKLYFYYVGWIRPKNTRFLPSIGLAVSKKNLKNFKKISYPILSRSSKEPFGCASPFVIKEGRKFKMWYVAIRRWIKKKNETIPIYNLSYSESTNGINWDLKKQNVLNGPANETISRPWIIKYKGKYHLWYSYRNKDKNFNIGYSTSLDGFKWRRKDNKFKIQKLGSNWNSQANCYPCVFKYQKSFYMLFNGNDYGRNGIGLLELIYD